MQVFKTFIKVLMSKAPIAMIYLVVFVAISVGITMTNDVSAMSLFEAATMTVSVFDEDDTPESRALRDFIAEKNSIVELENDRDVIMDALYYERVNYVFTIKSGYAQKLAAGETEGLFESFHMHTSNPAVYMGQFLNEYAGTVSAYVAAGNDVMTAIAETSSALSKEAEVTMASFESENYGASISVAGGFFFRFLPYIFISVFMNALCPVLLAMMKKDIRFRTNCSGIHPNSYTMQIFAGSAVFVAVIWLVFMVIGAFMNGGIYAGHAWIAVLNSFIFALFSAMLTIFVASFDPPDAMVNVITQIVSLGMSFLCGVFVDQSILGDGVLAAARFLPAYWYIRVNRMIEGSEVFDMSFIWLALGIEAAFAAVLTILTVLIRRLRYSRAA